MKDYKDNIDKIVRDKLIDYEENTSPLFWYKLKRRMKRTKGGIILLVTIPLFIGLLWMVDFTKSEEVINVRNTIETKLPHKDLIQEDKYYKTTDNSLLQSSLPLRRTDIISTEYTINSSNKGLIDNNLKNEVASICMVDTCVISSSESNCRSIKSRNISSVITNFGDEGVVDNSHISKQVINKDVIKSQFSISFEFSVDIPNRKFTSEDSYNDFAQYREKNETVNNNLSYGLLFNYQYKNFVISTGLNYSTLTESLNYNKNKTIIDLNGGYYNIDTISVIIYDENNNEMPIILGYDKVWVDEYTNYEYNVSSTNEYSYINIPIRFSYNYNVKKLSINPVVGASFGFLYKASGLLPVADSIDFVELKTNSPYLSKMIPSLEMGINLQYRLSPKYSFYFGPSIKYNLKSIYNNNYPLQSTYTNIGVRFGIHVNL